MPSTGSCHGSSAVDEKSSANRFHFKRENNYMGCLSRVDLTYAEKTKSALQPLRLSHHWCISPFRKKTRQQSQGEGQAKKKRTFLMCFLFSII